MPNLSNRPPPFSNLSPSAPPDAPPSSLSPSRSLGGDDEGYGYFGGDGNGGADGFGYERYGGGGGGGGRRNGGRDGDRYGGEVFSDAAAARLQANLLEQCGEMRMLVERESTLTVHALNRLRGVR